MMSSSDNENKAVSNICPAPLVIVISGPSGVGKDAILNRMKARKYDFTFITTVTTRRKRPDEKHQVDYHFISEEEYQQLLNNNGLLESARVYGNWYGVPKQPIREALAEGKDTILKVDVQGAATIKKILPEAVFIFIAPTTLDELSTRLNHRGSETASDLAVRLKMAEDEMQKICLFDYVVYNRCNEIDFAIDQIRAIVIAEKCRANPRKIVL
jgi:guanylate kinase